MSETDLSYAQYQSFEINIIIKKYIPWGIEHFDSDEWRCNADYYSYINKYSKGDTITHKLNVAPF